MDETSIWQSLSNSKFQKLNFLLIQLHNILKILKTRTNSMEVDINTILKTESADPKLENAIKHYMWSTQNSFDDQVASAFDCLGQFRNELGLPSAPTIDEFEKFSKYTMQLIHNDNIFNTKPVPIPLPKPDSQLPSIIPSPIIPENNFDSIIEPPIEFGSEPMTTHYIDFLKAILDSVKTKFKLSNITEPIYDNYLKNDSNSSNNDDSTDDDNSTNDYNSSCDQLNSDVTYTHISQPESLCDYYFYSPELESDKET